jgi:translation elongation factor EF-G
MRLPVIKKLVEFTEANDQDYLVEALAVLEHLAEEPTLKDEELDVIGELISNMYGAIEVDNMVREGMIRKDALNAFMQRVVGSIDKA